MLRFHREILVEFVADDTVDVLARGGGQLDPAEQENLVVELQQNVLAGTLVAFLSIVQQYWLVGARDPEFDPVLFFESGQQVQNFAHFVKPPFEPPLHCLEQVSNQRLAAKLVSHCGAAI